jgi:hypothetical protein
VKFKSIYSSAKQIDALIDNYTHNRNVAFVPLTEMEKMVYLILPDAQLDNFGIHKIVFRLQHKSHKLAFKVGKQDAIEKDHKSYKLLPQELRHMYFARVFWHTQHCLLQEYGVSAEASAEELVQLRSLASKYGLLDISCENIRKVDGSLKIIDAGVAPEGLFRLWKAADFILLRLPPPIRRALRKSRMLTLFKGR